MCKNEEFYLFITELISRNSSWLIWDEAIKICEWIKTINHLTMQESWPNEKPLWPEATVNRIFLIVLIAALQKKFPWSGFLIEEALCASNVRLFCERSESLKSCWWQFEQLDALCLHYAVLQPLRFCEHSGWVFGKMSVIFLLYWAWIKQASGQCSPSSASIH